MSYRTISDIRQSNSLRQRLVAAAAQEGKGDSSPDAWVEQNFWTIAASPGWAEAWASAEASGVSDPGNNESVITDGMILAVVQPLP